jgi:hypothetical protein
MKMVKKANKRMDQAGKKTRFERRGNDGQFHKVPTEKLDAFQKRLGTRATSALSPSSSKAQRIFYPEPGADMEEASRQTYSTGPLRTWLAAVPQ